jgi:hypothetical protein
VIHPGGLKGALLAEPLKESLHQLFIESNGLRLHSIDVRSDCRNYAV